MEQLAGIRNRTRQRTACTRRGAKGGNSRKAAKDHKNNRLIATWTFHQLAMFIAYKAARVGIAVEWVDPAYTSQTCPACFHRNMAADRRYVCAECGWTGHREMPWARSTTVVGLAGVASLHTGTAPLPP